MKKWMELAFNRRGLNYETMLAKFLILEQHAYESFYEELCALCDGLTTLTGTVRTHIPRERRVLKQARRRKEYKTEGVER